MILLNLVLLLRYFHYQRDSMEFDVVASVLINDTSDDVDHPKRLLNMHDFEYLIPKECVVEVNGKIQKPEFVVLIHSAPTKKKIRQGLRSTWMHSDPRMLSLFALGKVHSLTLQKKIEEENKQYNDILQGILVTNNDQFFP